VFKENKRNKYARGYVPCSHKALGVHHEQQSQILPREHHSDEGVLIWKSSRIEIYKHIILHQKMHNLPSTTYFKGSGSKQLHDYMFYTT
jgi:hypothetical protein